MSSLLFQPSTIGGLTLANRIVVAPMCQYSAVDGNATDWHLMHIGQMALSGAGLFIIEATAVSPEGRISPADLGLWNDDNETALRRVLDAVRGHSAMPLAIQLAHAGRKASVARPWEGGAQLAASAGGWPTVAPSSLPHADSDHLPHALDDEGLVRIRAAFAGAAKRAARLGLDAIEVHAAHGYLLHQFLSPLANARDDRYGGSLANRMRFPLEVFDTVREAFPPDRPVGVRISASDWVEGGWDVEQSIELARELKARGVDFIHVSSGGLSTAQKIPLSAGYQVGFAERIRRDTGLPTVAVGLITEADQAEAILQAGQADFIALARAMLYDPRWPWHAAARLGATMHVAPQYLRCAPRDVARLFG